MRFLVPATVGVMATALSGCTDPIDVVVPAGSIRNEIGMWWAPVSPGVFEMGSPPGEVDRFDDEIIHSVRITSGLWVAVTEVTQAQWRVVMGEVSATFPGAARPMDSVTWSEAILFCNRLSELEGLDVAYDVVGGRVAWDQAATGYRLPTEAEWEYFARAGTAGPFSSGKTLSDEDANVQAAYPYGSREVPGVFRGETLSVASFAANAWGLYDIHGNVWEWCWDRYGRYTADDVVDPRGADSGLARVIRGGSWYHFPAYARLACRGRAKPDLQGNPFLGFRPVRRMN